MPTAYNLESANAQGIGDYEPTNGLYAYAKRANNPNITDRYRWVGPSTQWTCIGFGGNAWAIQYDYIYWGTAVLDAGSAGGSGSTTTGGGESGNQLCIEYYDWWYDEFGHYHEEVTGTECFPVAET